MARPMSWSTGLRSLPSIGAGSSRRNGLEVTRMKRRKAAAIQPCTASTSAFSRSGRLRAEGRDERAEQREDQHPEEHRALVVPPDAGDLVEERLRRMRVLDDVEQREIGDDIGVDERGEGEADEQELRHRRRRGDGRQARVVAERADRTAPTTGRAPAPSARTRAKWPSSAIIALPIASRCRRGVRAFLPDALLLQRLDHFARHVALVVLGEHGVGGEAPSAADHALGDDALPFAEEVGKDAAIGDRRSSRCRR